MTVRSCQDNLHHNLDSSRLKRHTACHSATRRHAGTTSGTVCVEGHLQDNTKPAMLWTRIEEDMPRITPADDTGLVHAQVARPTQYPVARHYAPLQLFLFAVHHKFPGGYSPPSKKTRVIPSLNRSSTGVIFSTFMASDKPQGILPYAFHQDHTVAQ